MKTIEEIKNEVAVICGFDNWEKEYEFMNFIQHDKFIDQCIQEYGKRVAGAQREACKEAANDNPFGEVTAVGNTPLVTDNI